MVFIYVYNVYNEHTNDPLVFIRQSHPPNIHSFLNSQSQLHIQYKLKLENQTVLLFIYLFISKHLFYQLIILFQKISEIFHVNICRFRYLTFV